jgi:hypothetical protein
MRSVVGYVLLVLEATSVINCEFDNRRINKMQPLFDFTNRPYII